MKSIKEIDSKIEELKNKFFSEDSPKELTELLIKAQERIEKVAKNEVKDYIQHLVEMNDIAFKLIKYKNLAKSRNVFAECYRKLEYSSAFVQMVSEKMKQGEAKENALLAVQEEKEIEVITDHIFRNIDGIFRALERTISIVQSKLKTERIDFSVQSTQ